MNGTRDKGEFATADEGGEFDPKEAAQLLEQTKREARRKLDPIPPALTLLMAVVVLAAYTTVWLSVRGQHPYKGPTGWALTVLYTLVIIVIVTYSSVARRATAGVRGPCRPRPAEIAVLVVAWIAVYVFQGALYHAGASHAIVYGVYPATGPLMIMGLVGAALTQARANWPSFGACLMVSVICLGGAFAGPTGAWLVAGIGLSAGLLGYAVIKALLRRD